ncbi:hypothetical protein IWW34DRAFT_851917 [Fusarium oxysporum f. sp. albedinis]|nr:hypothetical protein IWW34DRAFT_851917 [Fusarium oxysporum f. sp. albedinis]KAK2482163.1 hypothetical protein H9L39_07802 [Fusarium oxysporum f. sp. albedinis]
MKTINSATPNGNDTQAIAKIRNADFHPYKVSYRRKLIRVEDHNQNNLGYDTKYLEVPSEFILKDMPQLIRSELRDMFFDEAASLSRLEDHFKIWRQGGALKSISRPCLPDELIEPNRFIDFLNKDAMVYFESDSVGGTDIGRIGWYIYREWLRLHDGRPPFQRNGLFAKPARIQKTGPRNLEEI